MNPAFVAGATGYTGRAVVAALQRAGVPCVAHVRPDSPLLAEWQARFAALGATVDTTPWKSEAMEATLQRLRPALVFALLGTTRGRGRRARAAHGRVENYATVDVGLTLMTYDAARRAGSTPRFVYLSSIGVRPDTRNQYLAARALVERSIMDGPLPYVIARPSFISGPDRDEFRLGERLGAVVSDALLAVAGLFGAKRLAARYRSTTPAILGEALVRAALEPEGNRVLESEELRAR
ncbi:MAG: NAD(P)H-binding protein [Gemmatimonadales bacterium]